MGKVSMTLKVAIVNRYIFPIKLERFFSLAFLCQNQISRMARSTRSPMRKEREFGKITDSNVERKFYIDYREKDKKRKTSKSNRQTKRNDRGRIMIVNSK